MYSTFCRYFKNVKNPKIEDIREMIKKGTNDFDSGLYGACEGGHIEITKFMIEHGANDWNYGLFGACLGGHIETVKLMIEHGANDFNNGLYNACCGVHIEIAHLVIKHGADSYYYLGNNNNLNNLKFYKLYLIYYPDNIDKDKYEKLVIKQDPIYTIIKHYYKNKHIKTIPLDLWRMTHGFL
jgi:ankyrin repeat protein